MPLVRVRTLLEPGLDAFRGIGDPELLRRERAFIAEGRWVVERVLDAGVHEVRSLLLNEAALRALGARLERLDPTVPIYLAQAETFVGLTGHDFHRGCLALVERPEDRSVTDLVRTCTRLLVLDDVANPDNVGGVFRNAAAFGVEGVLLSPGTCDPLYRKAIRTSMAAVFQVPFARVQGGWSEALHELALAGYLRVALTARPPAIDLERLAAPNQRLALLVGAEGRGLGDAAEAAADVRVRIPIDGSVDSLNLAVATGIALHWLATRFPPSSEAFLADSAPSSKSTP